VKTESTSVFAAVKSEEISSSAVLLVVPSDVYKVSIHSIIQSIPSLISHEALSHDNTFNCNLFNISLLVNLVNV
jgi:hypothetical protein